MATKKATKKANDEIESTAIVESSDEGTAIEPAQEFSPQQMQEAQEIHANAMNAKGQADQLFFELGRWLYEMFQTSAHMRLGAKNWADYIQRYVDFDLRKADYLKGTFEYFMVELAAHPEIAEAVKELGWTKASKLVRIADASNWRHWVELAKAGTTKELQAHIKTYKGTLPAAEETEEKASSGDKFHSKNFKLTAEQLANVEAALTAAGKLADSPKPGHALDLMASDFLITHGAFEGPRALRMLVKGMEARLGIKLIAIDKDNNFLHGKDHIQAMIGSVEIGEISEAEEEAEEVNGGENGDEMGDDDMDALADQLLDGDDDGGGEAAEA